MPAPGSPGASGFHPKASPKAKGVGSSSEEVLLSSKRTRGTQKLFGKLIQWKAETFQKKSYKAKITYKIHTLPPKEPLKDPSHDLKTN